MILSEIINILENKIIYLQQQRGIFVNIGDILKVSEIEQEISEVTIALEKLKS